jgi:menaquinone-dependent protoporphyrinogen oxidase
VAVLQWPDRRPPKPAEQTIDVADIVNATGAREHRCFAGPLRRDRLGFAERAVVAALHAPYGDFRDWDAIDAWAANIATSLTT